MYFIWQKSSAHYCCGIWEVTHTAWLCHCCNVRQMLKTARHRTDCSCQAAACLILTCCC